MKSMNTSTKILTVATRNMQYDMSRLNDNVGRPMSFMNTFMPW